MKTKVLISCAVTIQFETLTGTFHFLPAHPASFTHDLVSGMQSFNFGGSQDAMFLQICNENECFGLVSWECFVLVSWDP